MPIASKSMAPSNVPPIPNRRVNNGVRVDTIPKAIRGNVVNNPKREFESPVALLISSIRGPTLANAGRRLIAMNRIPAINKISV
jgi:hypothetical protein